MHDELYRPTILLQQNVAKPTLSIPLEQLRPIPWASIFIQHWGTIDRGAVGAEGDGVWEGVSPSPMGDGSGEDAMPLPRKFFDCGSQNGEF